VGYSSSYLCSGGSLMACFGSSCENAIITPPGMHLETAYGSGFLSGPKSCEENPHWGLKHLLDYLIPDAEFVCRCPQGKCNIITISNCWDIILEINQHAAHDFDSYVPPFGPSSHPVSSEPSVSPVTSSPTTSEPTRRPSFEPSNFPTSSIPTGKPHVSAPTFQPTTTTPTNRPTRVPTSSRPTRFPTTETPTRKPFTSRPTNRPTTKLVFLSIPTRGHLFLLQLFNQQRPRQPIERLASRRPQDRLDSHDRNSNTKTIRPTTAYQQTNNKKSDTTAYDFVSDAKANFDDQAYHFPNRGPHHFAHHGAPDKYAHLQRAHESSTDHRAHPRAYDDSNSHFLSFRNPLFFSNHHRTHIPACNLNRNM